MPSGALTQLPFQVLITDTPDPALSGTEALRRAAWLIRSHTLAVLPSVSSLKELRQFAKESHADRTLIGFANSLLDGPAIGELTGKQHKQRGVLPLCRRILERSMPETPTHRAPAEKCSRR